MDGRGEIVKKREAERALSKNPAASQRAERLVASPTTSGSQL